MVQFKSIVSCLLLPLLYINFASLAAGAVALGVMGQWQVIWIGMLMVFFSPYIIPILLIPAGIFSHFMSLYHSDGRRKKERMMFVASISYIILFLTLWCTGIFAYVTASLRPDALWAGLLWANSAALAPLFLWSSRDRNNIFIMTMVETAQAAMLILCVSISLRIAASFWEFFAIFAGILAFVTVVQAVYEEKFMKKTG